jgi:predicted alpha/beta-hydrolase family hydrolase
VTVITHGKLIAIGIAMGGEDAVLVDDERAMALEDAFVLCVGKHLPGKGSAQLPLFHTILT